MSARDRMKRAGWLVSAWRSAAVTVNLFIAVATAVFLWYEGATGCIQFSFASFRCWRHGFYPSLILLALVTGVAAAALPRSRGMRVIYLVVVSVTMAWLLAVFLGVLVPFWVNANKAPSAGGSFSNEANDDAYCCQYNSTAQVGDCPPSYNPFLDLDEMCGTAWNADAFELNSPFKWEIVWSMVSLVLFAVAVLVNGFLQSTVTQERRAKENYASGRRAKETMPLMESGAPIGSVQGRRHKSSALEALIRNAR